MTLARLIADLIVPRPAWRVTVRLGERCSHIGRLPAGIAADESEAADAYMIAHPKLFRRDAIRCRAIREGGR